MYYSFHTAHIIRGDQKPCSLTKIKAYGSSIQYSDQENSCKYGNEYHSDSNIDLWILLMMIVITHNKLLLLSGLREPLPRHFQ